jgi:hypothetical protein
MWPSSTDTPEAPRSAGSTSTGWPSAPTPSSPPARGRRAAAPAARRRRGAAAARRLRPGGQPPAQPDISARPRPARLGGRASRPLTALHAHDRRVWRQPLLQQLHHAPVGVAAVARHEHQREAHGAQRALQCAAARVAHRLLQVWQGGECGGEDAQRAQRLARRPEPAAGGGRGAGGQVARLNQALDEQLGGQVQQVQQGLRAAARVSGGGSGGGAAATDARPPAAAQRGHNRRRCAPSAPPPRPQRPPSARRWCCPRRRGSSRGADRRAGRAAQADRSDDARRRAVSGFWCRARAACRKLAALCAPAPLRVRPSG